MRAFSVLDSDRTSRSQPASRTVGVVEAPQVTLGGVFGRRRSSPETPRWIDAPRWIERSVRCSFCGKKQHEVDKLMHQSGVYICNECVDLANDIFNDRVRDAYGIAEQRGPWCPRTMAGIRTSGAKDDRFARG